MPDHAHRPETGGSHLETPELIKRGAIGTLAAALVNALVTILAEATLSIPATFDPLAPGRAAALTVLGGIAAVVVYWVVQRRARDPARVFVRVAFVALLLSFIPDVLLLANAASVPGTTALGVTVLMVLHVIAAVIIVAGLTWGNLEGARASMEL